MRSEWDISDADHIIVPWLWGFGAGVATGLVVGLFVGVKWALGVGG